MTRVALRLSDLPSLEGLPGDGLLNVDEAAAYLGMAPSTLEKWRLGLRGVPTAGPPYIRLHDGPKAPVRYVVGDLRKWLWTRRTDPASGEETPARAA